jgi:hypothetical protein
MAIHHRHLWCSGYLHDMGVASRVRLKLFCPRHLTTNLIDSLPVNSGSPHILNSQDNIIWECQNGGQLWGASAEAGYDNGTAFPEGICAPGWQSLFTAFILSLLVDLAFQVSSCHPLLAKRVISLQLYRCTCSSSTGAS